MAFWEDMDEKEVLKVIKSAKAVKAVNIEEIKSPVRNGDLSGKMSSLKLRESQEKVTGETAKTERLSKNLLDKLATLEKRLASVEKNGQDLPTLDGFIKFCKGNLQLKTCNYFAKRFRNKKSPDDATLRKVFDVLRLMKAG